MHKKILLVSLVMLIPGFVFAQATTSYECSYDGMQRRIVILTEPGVTVPCQVQYHKDTEMPGDVQTLWTASSDAGYCESKAKEFVAKLEGWGWACAAGTDAAEPEAAPEAAPEPPAEPEAADDDTEALEPAD
jgi:hypothetical protein